jgi:hypothetical protein
MLSFCQKYIKDILKMWKKWVKFKSTIFSNEKFGTKIIIKFVILNNLFLN